jgi:hypothetical protein
VTHNRNDREEAQVAAGSAIVDEPTLTFPPPPRFWGSRLGLATVVAVVSAVAFGMAAFAQESDKPVTTLRGIMASKQDFFNDAEVQRLLRENGFEVEVTPRGSYEVAREVIQNPDRYDFTFPSGVPPANLIRAQRSEAGHYHRNTDLFTSPIVLASFRVYAETLVRAGVASPRDSGDKPLYYTLDTAKFIELGERGETWNSIGIDRYMAEDGSRLMNGNRVLAQTSGVCRSNSGATYLALLAFVKNGGQPAQTEAEVNRLAEQIRPLITATGMPRSDLFDTYSTPEGRSQVPVVVVYEHQYFAHQLSYRQRTGGPDFERVLLYPDQEFQTDPTFIALKAGGADELARLLDSDPALRTRMMELGYRVIDDTDTTGSERLFQYLRDRRIPAPAQDPDHTRAVFPERDLLDKLIQAVGRGCPQ